MDYVKSNGHFKRGFTFMYSSVGVCLFLATSNLLSFVIRIKYDRNVRVVRSLAFCFVFFSEFTY